MTDKYEMQLISFKFNREKAVPLMLSMCLKAEEETRRVEQCRLFAVDDWMIKPETLLNKALVQDVFGNNGDYMMLVEDGQVVCGAGHYQYNGSTSIIMSRMWTHPAYRARWIGHEILDHQLRMMHTRYGMITFNEVNKPLYDKIASISGTTGGDQWPGRWRTFEPLGKMLVNGVDQYCLRTSLC